MCFGSGGAERLLRTGYSVPGTERRTACGVSSGGARAACGGDSERGAWVGEGVLRRAANARAERRHPPGKPVPVSRVPPHAIRLTTRRTPFAARPLKPVHRLGHTTPCSLGTFAIPRYTNFCTRFPS